MELLKQEKEQLFRTEENLTKDQQLQFLQQTMQGMQQVPGPRFFLFGGGGKGCMYSSEVKGQPLARTGKGEVEEIHPGGRKQKAGRWEGVSVRVSLVAHGQKMPSMMRVSQNFSVENVAAGRVKVW